MSRGSELKGAVPALRRRRAGRAGRGRAVRMPVHDEDMLVGGFRLRLLTREEEALLEALRRRKDGGAVAMVLAECLLVQEAESDGFSAEAVEAVLKKARFGGKEEE